MTNFANTAGRGPGTSIAGCETQRPMPQQSSRGQALHALLRHFQVAWLGLPVFLIRCLLQACEREPQGAGTRVDREAVQKASTTLHSESKTGMKLKGPKKEFVLLEHWDTKLNGELDESKVVQEVWQGKKLKGVWKTVGRVGVLTGEQYEDTNMSQRTEEHSGHGPFAEEALETKREVLQKVLNDAEEERQKHSVAAGPAETRGGNVLQQLQKLLPSLGLRDALQSEPAPSSEAAEATEAAEEEEEPSEQEEEKGPAARLVARLGGPKAAKAKPKAAEKTSAKPPSNSASKGAAKVPGQPASTHQPASPTPKGAADKKAAEPAAQTLQLDGRGKRLKENLRESLAKHEEQAK